MRLLKNSIYGMFGVAVPIIVSLVSVPIFVSTIGLERYGVLVIAWVLLGYFGQADFGIGRAITQRVSSRIDQPRAALAQSVVSAFASSLGFSMIAGVLIYLSASYFFSGPFQIDEALRKEMMGALWALGLCVPVVAMSGVAAGALMGLEKFKLSSAGTMIGSSAVQILPLLYALFVDTHMASLVVCSLAGRLLGFAILGGGVWHAFFRSAWQTPSLREMKALTSFGLWVMVSALVGPLMLVGDRFVIGSLSGAVAVAAYSIPYALAVRTQVFPIAIVQALFPRFASETAEASLRRSEDFTIFIGQLFAPVVIGLIAVSGPFLHLWLGENLDLRSIPIATVLFASIWINTVANVPYAMIQAAGYPRFTALLHVAELPVYIGLLFVLGMNFGLVGFAIAFGLRCLIDFVALFIRSGIRRGPVITALLPQAILIVLAVGVMSSVSSWLLGIGLGAAIALISCAFALLQIPASVLDRLRAVPVLSSIMAVLKPLPIAPPDSHDHRRPS
ncbi:MAG: oligosaccharide flippase family protein [Pseudomonadota bacterium]